MVEQNSTDPGLHVAHAERVETVLARLGVGDEGLSPPLVHERRQRHGRNVLPAAKTHPAWLRLLLQFNNALILFLIAAAVVAGALGHVIDTVVIVVVVLVNAIVGFVQEGKAERALAALGAMLAPRARVIRDGQRMQIDAADLVPGDIVLLEAGDRVPADLRLLRARGLLIDEAILTGESVAAEKHEDAVPADAALGDRAGMAWSGTLVAAGQGTGVVTAIGAATQIGRISVLMQRVDALATPLLRQINRFGRQFTAVAIAAGALLFAYAIWFGGYDWLDALMVVVALAVGVVPEGLPAVITITLAIGVQRMAARNAIVRRLPAVETLGSTSVICSDKTGTLTRNEMTARRLLTVTGTHWVSGAGYAPVGQIDNAADASVQALALVGLGCNDARLFEQDGVWRVDGDPMEGALIALAIKAGLDQHGLLSTLPRQDEIPFDAQHRYMATLHRPGDGDAEAALVLVKGAPEQVLAMCTHQLGADGSTQPLQAGYWQAGIAEAASGGERVLGFARKRLATTPHRFGFGDMHGLELVGMIGFIDPPRAEAMAAVADCHRAGIAVKMITGDHAATAAAIAGQLGLAKAPVVLTGADLDGIDDAQLPTAARAAQVFARTSPEHKLRVVRALQSTGAVVAMTGDGVNDAPSLKQADVGIAMGRKGTEAAKEAAQMVLADDNFASIVAAVYEGRTVYDNIRKVIAWTLPTNGGEALAIIAALLFGWLLPMTPVQILWINMVLTVTLGLVLAFEPSEPGIMRRPPRRANAPLMSPFMIWRTVLVSLLFVLGAFGIFAWATVWRGLDVETARTLVVNTFCVMEIFYLFSVRYLHMSSFSWQGAKGTNAVLYAVLAVVIAQLLFTYAPWLQALFDTRPVALLDGLVVIAIGVAVMLVLEIEKFLLRRYDVFDELRQAGDGVALANHFPVEETP